MDQPHLNAQQLSAVHATEGYVRVIAGAGSGKTRVLTSRYVHLVKDCHVDPSRILCVTFTRKAAKEMRERIVAALGELGPTSRVSTIHSFCAEFLRSEIGVLGYAKGFRIADEKAQSAMIKRIVESDGRIFDRNVFYDFSTKVRNYKVSHLDYAFRIMNHAYPDHVVENPITPELKDIDAYLLMERKGKLADFDDLVLFTQAILNSHGEVRERWANRYDYLEIDEAQDVSVNEMAILQALAEKHHNLFLVGDPDQNIYEWRDSDNAILLDFDKKHPDAKTFLLTLNYRSTQSILTAANALISHNQNRIDKSLIPQKGLGEPPRVYRLADKESVAQAAVDLIQESHARGEAYRENAVLFRCNYNSQAIEDVLKRECLPYEIVGGISFYQLTEIKDVIALIKLLAFEDDESLLRLVNKPSRKFGPKKVEILQRMQEKDQTLLSTLRAHAMDPAFKGTRVEDFLSAYDKGVAAIQGEPLDQGLNDMMTAIGYRSYLSHLKSHEHQDNVDAFLDSFHAYLAKHPDTHGFADYFNDALIDDGGEVDDKDRIPLMTVHAAKGLEFRNVYVIGLEDGNFPHRRTLDERGMAGLEEERRLFYVAMTRAKDRLFLFSASLNDFDKPMDPSRFLLELGESNIEAYDENGPVEKRGKKKQPSAKALSRKRKKAHKAFDELVFGKEGK